MVKLMHLLNGFVLLTISFTINICQTAEFVILQGLSFIRAVMVDSTDKDNVLI